MGGSPLRAIVSKIILTGNKMSRMYIECIPLAEAR